MRTHATTLALLATTLFATGALHAQQDETVVDKLRLDLSGAWGGWNTQLTSLGDQNATMFGGFGGLEFNKTLFLGWSVYKLSDAVRVGDTDAELKLRYNGPFVTYTPFARSVIHPKVGLQFGFGRLSYDTPAGEVQIPTDRIAILQPSLGGELNVLRWFRLGGEFGYRFGLDTASDAVSDKFVSGPYGAVTLKFGFSWGAGNSNESIWRNEDGADRG